MRSMNIISRVSSRVLTSMVILGGLAVPAGAMDTPGVADTAAVVERVFKPHEVDVIKPCDGLFIAADLRINQDPRSGYAIGSGEGAISFVPNEVATHAAQGERVDSTIVFKDLAAETDAVWRAGRHGGEQLLVLWSSAAPESFAWTVKLPKGASLVKQHDGSVALRDEGTDEILTITSAPSAKDVEGKEVATSLSVDGDQLTWEVNHRKEGVAYPVVADPWWMGASGAHWEYKLRGWCRMGCKAPSCRNMWALHCGHQRHTGVPFGGCGCHSFR